MQSDQTQTDQSSYDSKKDGYLKFFFADKAKDGPMEIGEAIPTDFRLYHSNAQSVALMDSLAETAGEYWASDMYMNDLDIPNVYKSKGPSNMQFMDGDLKNVSLSAKILKEIQTSIEKDMADYKGEHVITPAEEKRIAKYGKKVAFLNPIRLILVDGVITPKRIPGSCALRDNPRDMRTYHKLRHYRDKSGNGLGISTLMKYNSADPGKNNTVLAPDVEGIKVVIGS